MNKKKVLTIIFILFPFLDLITALLTRNTDLIITPGVIIKSLFMLMMLFYVLKSKSKYKNLAIITFILFGLYFILYFIFKPELINELYIFSELSYLFKLLYFPVIFLGLLCFYDDNDFSKKELIWIMKFNLITFSLLLLIPLLFNCAYPTYPEFLKGYIGWFYAGNEIANIMVLLSPLMYFFISKTKKYMFLLSIPIIYLILCIGTKVSLLGLIIVSLLSFLFFVIKEKKLKSVYVIESFIILLLVIIFSWNSNAVQNYNNVLNNNYIAPEEIIIDENNKDEVNEIIGKIDNYYQKNELAKILKSLLSSRDIYLANTVSIYNDDLTNNNIWFGIGFSNTHIVNNNNITKLVEIDIIDAFFHYGIIGFLIMLSPYIGASYLALVNKKKLTLESFYYILILLLLFGISCLSGHVFTAPAVSIYLVFYLLLLLNEFKCIGRNKKLKDKISILALHMSYGGIERSIVNQANMLSQNYKVEIICLYKLSSEIPYQLNKNVKLIYLSDLKPNKEEFLKYLYSKNISKIISEGLKAIKILYLKKKLMGDYIYNSDSKIIISTRLEFTKSLNKYYNVNCIRIAEEHVYHNNNIKYIKKLKKHLKHINYLIPASKYLTKDYNKYFVKRKVKIIYIPQAVDNFPKKINTFTNKNIIYVGRLEPVKGVIDLIEIFKLINKQNKDIKLTIIGDGSQKNIIEKMIKKYKLNKNIKVTGYLSGNNLIKEYKKASLFILTSFEESFGLVLLEAMSYGIPCIAFDSALGAKEIINSKNGILVKKRNKERMSQEIIKYFKKVSNQKMIKEARNTAEDYSFGQIKLKWEDFIINILKKL